MRRRGLSLGAAFALLALAGRARPSLARLKRSWPSRIAVSGHSMAPTLRDGDWLLVEPLAGRAAQPGELVVARDPRAPERVLIKRVTSVDADGDLILAGDHRAHEHERIGPVEGAAVIGRAWLRYWPPTRLGRVG